MYNMCTCSAETLTLNEKKCTLTTGYTIDNLCKIRIDSTTESSSINRDNSVSNTTSKTTIADSSTNNNSTVQRPRKPLKLSLSKKQHSYQECDPPIDVNHPSKHETNLQLHPGNCCTQVHAPQDTNRCIQIQA